ncbi:MAG: hypothetical protein PHF86_01865 [Candidatus Nanoarchaeia archaeon]|nr:hypothetical protein [Candidatus Nanoarchaeia archaeon]
MRAKTINEINFERKGSSLNKLKIGTKYSPKTAEVSAIMDLNGNLIQDEYDKKKFLQNIQNGFYPSNIMVLIMNNTDNTKFGLTSNELKDYGYLGINYKDKYYKLG